MNSTAPTKENMSVVYASPNRSHHFRYAEGLEAEGMLKTFVQGYPRIKKAPINVTPKRIMHRDGWQLAFIPFFRILNEHPITHSINLRSKNHIDDGLKIAMSDAQIGLFYNGCGLNSIRHWKGKNRQFVCEAVNSHLDYQSELLKWESTRLGIDFRAPYQPERSKRLAEYEESDYILCPSGFVAKSFESKGFPREKLLINPFGIGGVEISKPKKKAEAKSPFVILYVGSINYRKGLRYLIEAFKLLKISKKELWIVGPRLDPDGISDLSIPERVIFKGVLKGEELKQAYQSADVFVQPSIEEGLSLVIGEALGHGLPVIATFNTGAEEIFADSECGFLIPIRDAKILANRITRLVDDPVLRQSMSSTAMEKSRSFGGWSASQKNLCGLMRSIQTGKPDE